MSARSVIVVVATVIAHLVLLGERALGVAVAEQRQLLGRLVGVHSEAEQLGGRHLGRGQGRLNGLDDGGPLDAGGDHGGRQGPLEGLHHLWRRGEGWMRRCFSQSWTGALGCRTPRTVVRIKRGYTT